MSVLLDSFGCGYGFVPDPCGYRSFSGRAFDRFELGVGKPEVHGMGPCVASCRSTAWSFFGGHENNYSVKRKMIDTAHLMLYDKDMTNNEHQTKAAKIIAEIDKATVIRCWLCNNFKSSGPDAAQLMERHLDKTPGHEGFSLTGFGVKY